MENAKQNDLIETLKRVLEIMHELETRKALYEELDALTLELQRAGFASADLEGQRLTLTDNFADSNTAFRPAFVRRYELKAEALEKALKREARAAKRSGDVIGGSKREDVAEALKDLAKRAGGES